MFKNISDFLATTNDITVYVFMATKEYANNMYNTIKPEITGWLGNWVAQSSRNLYCKDTKSVVVFSSISDAPYYSSTIAISYFYHYCDPIDIHTSVKKFN